MTQTTVQAVPQPRIQSLAQNLALIVGAALLMDILGRFSLPLPFTPVPLTLANFGVLLIALTLGSRRAAAVMLLYLAEGAVGMPVFSLGIGGVAQILGVTGGYLMSYPVAAFLAGWIAERGSRSVLRASVAALSGEVLLFLAGISWLAFVFHVPLSKAAVWGAYPFAFAEIIKIMSAVAISLRLPRSSKLAGLLA